MNKYNKIDDKDFVFIPTKFSDSEERLFHEFLKNRKIGKKIKQELTLKKKVLRNGESHSQNKKRIVSLA